MLVLKFGGTSVSSKKNIEQIKAILVQKTAHYIVVVSAFSGVTNLLEQLCPKALTNAYQPLLKDLKTLHHNLIEALFEPNDQEVLVTIVQEKIQELESICKGIGILQELSPKTQARVLSSGEELSSLILFHYLKKSHLDIHHLDSKALIVTDNTFLTAEVDFKSTNENIQKAIGPKNYIAGGFIASTHKGEPSVLGRGGSDYTASIFANAIDATSIEIWSDVNGMHDANPKLVKSAKSIENLSYEEAFEMAYFGAKVLYPPSILPLIKKGIPLYLKNTFHPEQAGTLISNAHKLIEDKIQGVSSLNDIAIITVSGVGLAKQKGKARKVFQTLEDSDINIILISQSCSEQSIGIGIKQKDLDTAVQALDTAFESEITRELINPVKVVKDQIIIALIGDNMKNQIGLCGKVFGAIGESGINITAIAQGASERNISIVIHQKDEVKALNVIHEQFFRDAVKDVHLFIAGIGNVGSEFLNIIYAQKQKLIEEYKINLKIMGVANSKKYLLTEEIALEKEEILNLALQGTDYTSFPELLNKIAELNLRNSIFIDNTAAEVISKGYPFLLQNFISVITCNKIACSSEFEFYQELNNLAKEHKCHFKYETSVGAALPILKTIHDLNISGDKINKIEAVISGSLNFIFNEYQGEDEFAAVVLRAKQDGYTEPDPLIDLSGLDVMRKILILSREAGLNKELSDISYQGFLPEACAQAISVEDLFLKLKQHEAHFKSLYTNAHKKGNKLKVVAKLDQGEMSVSLQEIPPQSPFYNLEGKDNVVAINTNRYLNEPLVIKGAGAGAVVTASGVFADLMFVLNR